MKPDPKIEKLIYKFEKTDLSTSKSIVLEHKIFVYFSK